MFDLVYLGTSASAPSIRRSLPSLMVMFNEHRFMVDCGEGTQRQLLTSGIGLKRLNKILITHSHFDHLDYDAVPAIAKNGKTVFVTTPSCTELLLGMGIPEKQIRRMECPDTAVLEGVRITSLEADHGGMVPDSYGYVLEMGGRRIYITGDTCFREDIFRAAAQEKPDVIVACINGRFGNLNAEEAARAAKAVGAKTAIPCHFWTFMQHGGDPAEFARCMEQYAPEAEALFFTQGEIRIL